MPSFSPREQSPNSLAIFHSLSILVILASCSSHLQAQAGPRYEIIVSKNVMIPMRDGVTLASDIYRPGRNGVPADGKFPTILERTPYNKDGGIPNSAGYISPLPSDYFVPRGYIVVLQDIRGRYKSGGHWQLLQAEPNDGFDTAKWIGAQSWSDGNIGTIGTSYDGGTQHALAIAGAPFVKAMIPVDAMSDFGRYGVRHNGAFELRFFNWVFTLGNSTGTTNAPLAAERAAVNPAAAKELIDMGNHVAEYVRGLPLRPGTTPLQFAPDYEAWLIEAMKHGDYDDFWKNAGPSVVDHLDEYKDIPVYHVTGWYDSWGTPVANMNYVELKKAKKSLQRLIVGPWTHGGQTRSFAGDAQFTPDAALDFDAFRARWFDHWLKDLDNGIEREAPVRIYIMGGGDAHKTAEGRLFVGGKWRDEQDWPLARTAPTPYYLHRDGSLSTTKPADEPPTTYSFDPRNPVPTLGGNVSSQGTLMVQGATDQRCRTAASLFCLDSRPLSARNDILVFQTQPLTHEIEVTGRLIVKLWASSDSLDTDFTAKLIDVYPPNKDFPAGVDLNIGDSIVRARYRKGAGQADLLKPGQPYEFTIEMYPTSLVFMPGHRIRLDISSSNFPRFDVNPNTGEPLNNNRRWRVAENSIYADPQHPSHIVLPVIPASNKSTL
jgi:putative CocE/NonD family hydrolase